jgi:hypothetical protein
LEHGTCDFGQFVTISVILTDKSCHFERFLLAAEHFKRFGAARGRVGQTDRTFHHKQINQIDRIKCSIDISPVNTAFPFVARPLLHMTARLGK